jgi:hypothetical protein
MAALEVQHACLEKLEPFGVFKRLEVENFKWRCATCVED